MDLDGKSAAQAGFTVSADVGAGFGFSGSAGAEFSGQEGFAGASSSAGGGDEEQKESERDAEGYHVEQRMETEHRSQSQEVRELDDHRTETRRWDEKEVRLEEVKSREFEPRPATFEEMRALLGAQFEGGFGAEVQVSREITVEEFTKIERSHGTTEGGMDEMQTEVTTTEQHKTEKISEQPQWKAKAILPETESEILPEQRMEAQVTASPLAMEIPIMSLGGHAGAGISVNIPNVGMSVSGPQVTVAEAAVSVEPPVVEVSAKQGKPKGKVIGIFGKLKSPKKKDAKHVGEASLDVEVMPVEGDISAGGSLSSAQKLKFKASAGASGEVEPMDVSVDVESPTAEWQSKHHEIKHKRHVIEEVVLEDTDTFYEELPKRRRLFGKGKENVVPVIVERRHSTGDIPEPGESLPQKTGSTSNVSSDQQVTFVVEYDVPKDRKRWTMPAFPKRWSKGFDIPEEGAEGGIEKKPKSGTERQDEVIVEDEDLFTDAGSSIDRKRWRFGKPKFGATKEVPESTTMTVTVSADMPEENVSGKKWTSLPFLKKSTGEPSSLETVTFIVQGDLPTGHLSGKPKSSSTGEIGEENITYVVEQPSPGEPVKVRGKIGFEWPKFSLHFGPKSGKTDAGSMHGEGEVVTYVIQKPSEPAVEAGGPGFQWPKLKVHFGGKFIETGEVGDEKQVETANFIIEHVDPEPVTAAVDASGESRLPKIEFNIGGICPKDFILSPEAETQFVTYVVDQPTELAPLPEASKHEHLQWPMLKLYYTVKPASQDESGGGVDTYVVEHIVPAPKGDGDRGNVGIHWPRLKLHIGGKLRKRSKTDIKPSEQIVTFVVEHPSAPSTVRRGLRIKLPKIKFHIGGKSSKRSDSDTDVSGDNETYIIDQIIPVPTVSTDGGFAWPKFKMRFTGRSDRHCDSQTVTYAVEVPGGTPEVSVEGGPEMPKLNLHFGLKTDIDGQEAGGVETVNYTVEEPAASGSDAAKIKAVGGIRWPKMDIHFATKLPVRDAGVVEADETVEYVIEYPDIPAVQITDDDEGWLRKWPKLRLHLGTKEVIDGDQPGEDVVTYVAQHPSPEITGTTEGKFRGGIDLPKFSLSLPKISMKGGSAEPQSETVTYVVEAPEPESGYPKSRTKFAMPKFRLRFRSKQSDDDHTSRASEGETLTYIIEGVDPLPSEGMDIRTDGGFQWPKLSVLFGSKITGTAGGTMEGKKETLVYVAENPALPLLPDTEGKGEGGVQLPKLKVHFRGKSGDTMVKGAVEGGHTVTYIVDPNSIAEDKKDEIVIPWPKLNIHFGKNIETDIDEGVEIKNVTYTVDHIIPTPTTGKRFHINWPKFKLRFGGRTPKGSSQAVNEEVVTYVVNQPSPEGTGSAEAEASGGINWPKFRLTLPKVDIGKKYEGKGQPSEPQSETVTYVVEGPELPSGEVKGRGKIALPKFKLHFRSKFSKDIETKSDDGETLTYVIEEVDPVSPEPADVESGFGFEWPKLKVLFGAKIMSAGGVATEGKKETLIYVVEQPAPAIQSIGGTTGEGEMLLPMARLHFKGKFGDQQGEAHPEGGQFVTYVVDRLSLGGRSDDTVIPWPKLNVHFGIAAEKVDAEAEEDAGKEDFTYTVDYVIPAPAAERGFSINWPKFKMLFGGKGKSGTEFTKEKAVQPTSDPSSSVGARAQGGVNWPKFRLTLPKLSSRKSEPSVESQPETVTYVVEAPDIPHGEVKGHGKIKLPKFKLHFRTKYSKEDDVSKASDGDVLTYVIEDIDPMVPEPSDIESVGGFQWPKLKVLFGAKITGEGGVTTEGKKETLVYIVEQPSPALPAVGGDLPKLRLHFRGKFGEKQGDVSPEGGQTVTYVVDPASVDKKDDAVIPWPKLNVHFGIQSDKVEADGGEDVTYTVDHVIPTPAADKGFHINWPKFKLRFGGKGPKGSVGAVNEESVTYVVDQPSIPEGSGGAEGKVHGGINWPKFRLTLPKFVTAGKVEGGAQPQPETVTYIVEGPEVPSGDVKGRGKLEFPKFKLHFRSKFSKEDDVSKASDGDMLTYVIEDVDPMVPEPSDIESGGGFQWPKLKVLFGAKITGEGGVTTEGKKETLVYIVEQPSPALPAVGGDLPKLRLHFRGKFGEKQCDVSPEGGQTVTYVVDPASVDKKDDAVIPWPKLNVHFGIQSDKVEADGGEDVTYTVDHVIPTPAADKGFHINWPKFKLRFGGKGPKGSVGAVNEESVTYVVDQPSIPEGSGGAEGKVHGSINWPKFRLTLPKFGTAGKVEGGAQPQPETVTYVVEGPEVPSGDVKGRGKLDFPKFKLHFRSKFSKEDDVSKASDGDVLTYVIEDVDPVVPEPSDIESGGGFQWPKLKVLFGAKITGEGGVTTEGKKETLVYIVEQPSPALPAVGGDLPKLRLHFRGKFGEKQGDVSPEGGQTVAYVVDPASVDKKDDAVIPWPKLNVHFGIQSDKVEADGGEDVTYTVDHVIPTPAADKGFHINWPKFKLRFGGKGPKGSVGTVNEESVTYVVDQPSIPEGSGGAEGKVHGGINWPKFRLTLPKFGTAGKVEGGAQPQPETVTYVVEGPEVPSGDVKGRGKLEFPKFKLHFRSKFSKEDDLSKASDGDVLTYVIEDVDPMVPEPSDIETGGGFQWPKLKVLYGAKITGEGGVTTEGKKETLVYIVEQPSPALPAVGGDLPKLRLHFRGKFGEKQCDVSPEGGQTVTYVVDPASVDKKDDAVIPWPKLNVHFGIQSDKVEADGGEDVTYTVDHVIPTPAADKGFHINWPKFKLRFGGKGSKGSVGAVNEESVTFVVDEPTPGFSAGKAQGGISLPKFKPSFPKFGGKRSEPRSETVTYVVERPEPSFGDVSGKTKRSFPKFKLHFRTKSVKEEEVSKASEIESLSYIIEEVDPVSPWLGDVAGDGFQWPKLKVLFGAKITGEGGVTTEGKKETLVYIVEQPSPALPAVGGDLPKLRLHFRGKFGEKQGDVSPEGGQSVTYVVDPASVDKKDDTVIPWPKLSVHFGIQSDKVEADGGEDVTYTVDHVIPTPAADKGFHINWPKFKLRFGGKGPKGSVGAVNEESVTYVVDQPSIPEGSGGAEGKVHGGINWPKFRLTLPKFGTAGKVEGGAEPQPETVTYVVEGPEVPSGDVKGRGKLEFPKFKLHFRSKFTKEDDLSKASDGDVLTYVIEDVDPMVPEPSDIETGGGFQWPKLKVLFGAKITGEGGVTTEGKKETLVYIVEQPSPALPAVGGDLPKLRLHFRGKFGEKQGDVSPEGGQSVTYVVDPASVDKKDDTVIPWPKLNVHFGIQSDKVEADGGEDVTYTVDHVIPTPAADKGFHINWPKFKLRFGGKGPKGSVGAVNEESVTYVVDQPSIPEGSGGAEGKVHGGINWPKFRLTLPKFGTAGKVEGGAEPQPETVTYVVEGPEVPSGDVKGRGKLEFPKFKLHFRSKFTKEDDLSKASDGDVLTYVIEDVDPMVPEPSDIETGGGFQWPKLKVLFGAKITGEGGVTTEGKKETLVYIVEQPSPALPAVGGDLPKLRLHFRRKFGEKQCDVSPEGGQTVTYVVDPASVDKKDDAVIPWPKLNVHFGIQSDKVEADGGEDVTYTVDHVIPTPAADKGFHINWPKFKLRFGGKGPKGSVGAVNEESVTYVVDQPSIPEGSGGAEGKVHGSINWPKFRLTLPKFGTAGKVEGGAQPQPETVTYVVEGPEVPSGDVKGRGKLEFPKFKLHFRSKFSKEDDVSKASDGDVLTYVIEDVDPMVPEPSDIETGGGFQWPKLKVLFGTKITGEGGVTTEGKKETLVYIVEQPSPALPAVGGDLPKLRLHFRGKFGEKQGDVSPEGGQTVTYVVDPASVDKKDDAVIPWPKLNVHFGIQSDKVEADGGEDVTYTVDHVIPTPAADKGFHINWPKFKLRFGGKGPKGSVGAVNEESVTYVVDQPSIPEGSGGAEGKVHGGINWPKFRLTLPKFGTAGKVEGGAEPQPETVTYVVEGPEVPSGDVKGRGKLEFPKFKLHFRSKFTKEDDLSKARDGDVLMYVIEDVDPMVPEPSDIETGGSFQWPKLKVLYGAKITGEGGVTTEGKKETLVYIVEQPSPALPAVGGDLPKLRLHFRGKFGEKQGDVSPEGGQTITYVVDPASVDKKDDAVIPWPKLNVHFGIQFDKVVADDGEDVTYTVDHVIPTAAVDKGFHINWPKFKLRFGGKGQEGDFAADRTEPVPKVPEPSAETGGKIRVGGSFPKFNIRFGQKSGMGEPEIETVTYIVEAPEPTTGGQAELPRFKLRFGGKKSSKDAGVGGAAFDETVTYVVQQIDPVPVEAPDVETAGGFSWPKLKVRFGSKVSGDISRPEWKEETVVYVVEQPTPLPPVAPDVAGGRVRLPKFNINFWGKTAAEDDTAIEGGQTVTYVVEQPEPIKAGGHVGMQWPKLDVHFGIRSPKHMEVNGEGAEPETVTFVVDHIIPLPPDMSESAGGIHFPKINWNFGGKIHGGGEADEEQPIPEPSGSTEGKGRAGIVFPKPKFNIGFGRKGKGPEGELFPEPETVTYVVEGPEPSTRDVKARGKIGLPKFDMHWATKGDAGKDVEKKGEKVDETVTFVVKNIDPLPSEPLVVEGDFFHWPKLNVRFGAHDDSTDGKGETLVYVVEQPAPVPSIVAGGTGGIHLPKFRFNFDSKVETDTNIEGGQTVTYVVDEPSEPEQAGGAKGLTGIKWPKLNVHFGVKAPIAATGINGEVAEPDTVTYVVDHVIPVPVEAPEAAGSAGIHFPKIKWHFGGRAHGSYDVTTVPAVEPAELPEGKARGGVSLPRFNVGFGKKGKLPEGEAQGGPETITYVVESPEQPSKGRGKISLPKFNLRWGGKGGKVKDVDVNGVKEDESIAFVVKNIDPLPVEPAEVEAGGTVLWPKLNVRFGADGDVAEPKGEAVVYVVEQPSPRLSGTGGISLPKFKIRFSGMTSADGDIKLQDGQTVTYVAEKPSEPSASVKVPGGIQWPKLNVHFGVKAPTAATEISGEAAEPDTVTYIVDHVIPVPVEAPEAAGSAGIHFPKINWHFGGRAHGSYDVTTEPAVEPAELPEGKARGGVSLPRFNVGFGKKGKLPEGEAQGGPETITYVVETPDRPPKDVKARGTIGLPKFDLRWGGKEGKDKDAGIGGKMEVEPVSFVVKNIDPVPLEAEGGGGFQWPKLKVHFGAVETGDEGKGETLVYVVEQPAPLPAGAKVDSSGAIHMPKFNIHFGKKISADEGTEGGQNVTYVVESPDAEVKGQSGIQWPKLNVHFGVTGPAAAAAVNGEVPEPESVTYVVDHVIPVPVEPREAGASVGIHFPKIKWHFGSKAHGSYDVNLDEEQQEPESRWQSGIHLPKFHFGRKDKEVELSGEPEVVTYVVEEPEPVPKDTGVHGGFELPKFKLHWGGKVDNELDVPGKKGEAAVVTYVVKTIDPIPSAPEDLGIDAAGFQWPKLKVHFGTDISGEQPVGTDGAPEAGGDAILYIPEQPAPALSGSVEAKGGFHWPKFTTDVGGASADKDGIGIQSRQVVTYIVDQPSGEGDAKGQVALPWPKLDVHFLMMTPRGDALTDCEVERVVPVAPEVRKGFGLRLPKFNWHLGGQADSGVKTTEPIEADADAEAKGRIVISLPKVTVFGKKPSDSKSSSESDISGEPGKGEKKKWTAGFRFGKKKDVGVDVEDKDKKKVEESPKVKQPKWTLFGKGGTGGKVEVETKPLKQPEVIVGGAVNYPEPSGRSHVSGGISAEVPEAQVSGSADLPEAKGRSAVRSLFGGTDASASYDINYSFEGPRIVTDRREEFVRESSGGGQVDLITSTPKRGGEVTSSGLLNFNISSADRPFHLSIPGFELKGELISQPVRVSLVGASPGSASGGGNRSSGVPSEYGGYGASRSSPSTSVQPVPGLAPWQTPTFIIVAIDFGTTFSGYAFCFPHDVKVSADNGEPLPSIHVMRKWEGGDPGAFDQKTPTTLLLTPDGDFHSFGFTARDFYHDLSPDEAKRWLYFEKFKMALHYNSELNDDTELSASNGKRVKALTVFAYALRFFRNHALQELSEQSGTRILNEDVRWVITVPAIWKAPAKQFMRQAAYQAEIASSENPEQLMIALEPEAASIFVRRQRLQQLLPESESVDRIRRAVTPEPIVVSHSLLSESTDPDMSGSQTLKTSFNYHPSVSPMLAQAQVDMAGTRYMVVDCGGGTVDITVYEMVSESGKLKELYMATGGPFGSTGVDRDFESLLVDIFGADFIDAFKRKRPAGWVDLLLAFESRKRAATPFKSKALNVSLPFSFTDYHKKFKNCSVESAVRRYNHKDIRWSSQGMLRLMPDAMNELFKTTLLHIKQAVADVLRQPSVRGLKYIFLVGGFAESPMLQLEIRNAFSDVAKIMLPSEAGLTILKGAVCFGLHPGVIATRKSQMTYGVSVLKRFQRGRDPESKLIVKDGIEWCADSFDALVTTGESVAVGDTVVRRYAPAAAGQRASVFHVYSSSRPDVQFVTDQGIQKVGTLRLELSDTPDSPESTSSGSVAPREIQARMTFSDTEIKVIAVEVATGKAVRASVDFLSK